MNAPSFRRLLENLKRGDCFCECAIDNPMMRGQHSAACKEAMLFLQELKDSPTDMETSILTTFDQHIDEGHLHDDLSSFMEMDGPLLQVASARYGIKYFRLIFEEVSKEDYFADGRADNLSK